MSIPYRDSSFCTAVDCTADCHRRFYGTQHEALAKGCDVWWADFETGCALKTTAPELPEDYEDTEAQDQMFGRGSYE